MTEGVQPGADGGIFDAIDPKLTVFALANGTDLSKDGGLRRLEWFTEGLERAILIEAASDGRFRIRVMSWKTGATDQREESVFAEGTSADEIGSTLSDAITAANEL